MSGRFAEQIPKRHIHDGFCVEVALQEPIQLAHRRIDTKRGYPKNFRCHFGNCARHTIGKGGQIVRDRADLSPAFQTSIRFQTQHMGLDRVAGLSLGHVIGFMAGEVDGP